MASWYVGSVQWTAVTAWAAQIAYGIGDLRRQLAAPAVGSERVFRCTTAGVSGAAEPAWTTTKASTTNDATVVWTEVTGDSLYGWTAAHARLTSAVAWGAAGDTYYVASNHSTTQASLLTVAFPGTAAAPDMCLCVNPAGSVPPVGADLTTGAVMTVTGNFGITVNGDVYGYGITFNSGTGNSAAADITLSNTMNNNELWENCAFNIVSTSTTAIIILGNSAASAVSLVNCTVSFGSTSQVIDTTGTTSISSKPGSVFVTGATIPTVLFRSLGNSSSALSVRGLDLSSVGSGKTLVNNITGPNLSTVIAYCKLDASVAVAVTPSNPTQFGADLIGCGSTGVSSRNERYKYQGALTTETTIVRTGGASDGTTAYSWKVVTTANSERTSPFETFEGVIWNSAVGSPKTLTINILTDNVTLTDAEAWLEVGYLGSSATPVSTRITDANANVLTAPANQTTNSETWASAPGTPVMQQLNVTFTPQMAGLIRWKVKIARPNTTVYIDPKPVIT